MTRKYSIIWIYDNGLCRGRLDPDVMTYDEAIKGIKGKFFIPRDARMCGV